MKRVRTIARLLGAGSWLLAGGFTLLADVGVAAVIGIGAEFLIVAALGLLMLAVGVGVARRPTRPVALLSAVGALLGLALVLWVVSSVEPGRIIWRDVAVFGLVGPVTVVASLVLAFVPPAPSDAVS